MAKAATKAAPDVGDFETVGQEDVAKVSAADLVPASELLVFHTESITPPPPKRMGRESGESKYPFNKLVKVGHWFLLPETFTKKTVASNVYRKRADGRKFKLIQIDTRFGEAIKRPDLVGRFGVWRVA